MNDATNLRAHLLATGRPRVDSEHVEGVGTCYFRRLSVGDVDEINGAKGKENDGFDTARSLARILCDQQGAPLFDVHNLDDLALLNTLDIEPLNAAATRVQERNKPKAEQGNVSAPSST